MELEVDDKDLKAAGAEILTDGHHGLRIHGWEIVSYKGSILKSSSVITYSLSFSLN
jgi:type 2A phosphatase activator TIP41